ncbi:MAG: IS1595 family transposase [Leptospirales bacterium]
MGLNCNTVNRFLKALRERLAQSCENCHQLFGKIEVDEFLSVPDVKGNRGGLYRSKNTLIGDHSRKGRPGERFIHSNGWIGYNGRVDVRYGKHLRVDHGLRTSLFRSAHINWIEGFWGFAKFRRTRLRRMSHSIFYLQLKESEFRYNHRDQDLYKSILQMTRKNPLF